VALRTVVAIVSRKRPMMTPPPPLHVRPVRHRVGVPEGRAEGHEQGGHHKVDQRRDEQGE